ncbi:MAG: hypothetical protein ACFB12_25930 [Leptolyngbyaceae cyanobacterium]
MAINKSCVVAVIEDYFIADFVKEILELDKFFSEGQKYVKFVLNKMIKTFEFTDELQNLSGFLDELGMKLSVKIGNFNASDKNIFQNPIIAADIEKSFYPLKVVDANLPSYIIPIRPGWAEEFVDEKLANLLLFGAKRDLMMRREMVYYRASKPKILEAPARILWYVSKSQSKRNFPDEMSTALLSFVRYT